MHELRRLHNCRSLECPHLPRASPHKRQQSQYEEYLCDSSPIAQRVHLKLFEEISSEQKVVRSGLTNKKILQALLEKKISVNMVFPIGHRSTWFISTKAKENGFIVYFANYLKLRNFRRTYSVPDFLCNYFRCAVDQSSRVASIFVFVFFLEIDRARSVCKKQAVSK